MSDNRLSEVTLDEASLSAGGVNAEHERRIALYDLSEKSSFAVVGADSGPYALYLAGGEDGRLLMRATSAGGEWSCHLSLAPLRRIIKDYFLICDSYNKAIRDATPMQIEAIDMGRRGLHNEGAEVLTEALAPKFTVDFETARRLFTLICALHMRN